MITREAECVLDLKNVLGEGPWWDTERGTLHWVDITKKRMHEYVPATGQHDFRDVARMIGAAAQTTSGHRFICAMQSGFYFLDPRTGEEEFICDPESELADNRFNDGKCDPAGRFWAGTMSMTGQQGAGALYCLDTRRNCRKALSGITTSNGLAWSPDHKTMYYIDTPTREVAAFPYDLETGAIGERTVAVRFAADQGFPDGMTIDAEGMIWVASWGGGHVTRWNPATGVCLETVRVPASHVTSCAFGGERLDELYITTAREGLNESTLEAEPLAGGLFRIRTSTQGLPAHRYGG